MKISLQYYALLNLRKFYFLLISYVGFLRFDEASHLRKGDIIFFQTHEFIHRKKQNGRISGRQDIGNQQSHFCDMPGGHNVEILEGGTIVPGELVFVQAPSLEQEM